MRRVLFIYCLSALVHLQLAAQISVEQINLSLENSCIPATLQYSAVTSSTAGAIVQHIWDFNDGATLSQFAGSYDLTYASDNYIVCLTVVDAVGNDTTICENIDVGTLGFIDAGQDQNMNCASSPITLNGSSPESEDYVFFNWFTENGRFISDPSHLQTMVDQPGTYVLEVNSFDGQCRGRDTVEVIADPMAPFISIGGGGVINCTNTSVTLVGLGPAGATTIYIWYDENGLAIGSSPNIVVSQGGWYTLEVEDGNTACIARQSVYVDETLSPPPSPQIYGPDIVDVQSANYFYANYDLEMNYAWTLNGADFVPSLGGPSASFALISGSNTADFEICLSLSNDCGTSPQSCRTIRQIDQYSPAASISGPTAPCTNEIERYEFLDDEFTLSNYNWEVLDLPGTDIVFGQNNSNMLINWGTAAGEARLVVTAEGNGMLFSDTLAIVVNDEVPNTPVFTEGVEIICGSVAAANYAVSPDPSASHYEWILPDKAYFVDGEARGNEALIGWEAGGSGLICVVPFNSCGAGSPSCMAVQQIGPVILETVITPTSCDNAADGAIDITMADQSGIYFFAWSNTFSTEDTDNLIAGVYTVTITDAVWGCELVEYFQVPVGSIELDLQIANCVTTAFNDGAIETSIIGGTGPFSFEWSEASIGDVEDPMGLAPGTYSLTVTDAADCTATASIELGDLFSGEMPDINVCEPAAVQLSALEQSPGFLYQWSPSVGLSCLDCPNPIATVSSNSLYTLTTVLSNGCIHLDTVQILFNNDRPTISNIAFNDPLCNGESDGSISFDIDCGVPPFDVAWTGGGNLSTSANTILIPDLSAGNYQITLTDANGDQDSISQAIELTDPTAIQINGSVVDATCGESNGSIDLTVFGGCAPYNYIWDFGMMVEDPTALPVGAYSVTVTDCNACAAVAIFEVIDLAALTISSEILQCPLGDEANGAFTLDVQGGNPPYIIDPPNLSNLSAGSYDITVTDQDGCSAVTNVVLEEIDANIPNEVFDICLEDSVQVFIEHTDPLSFSWSSSPNLSCLDCANPFVQAELGSNQYSVTITDVDGCTTEWIFTVNSTDCVWPGDTDTNRVVNHFDLLNIGLSFSSNGPPRPNASVDWRGQFSENWPQSTPFTQVNYKHIDADGDGQIWFGDISTIIFNWGEQYLMGEQITSSRQLVAPFYLEVDTIVEGETVGLPLILGDSDNQAENIYGLAFSIEYDSALIKENSVDLQFTPSWLGAENTDFIQVQKDFYSPGRIDVAFSRIDGQNISGMGEIAQLFITIEDDILLHQEQDVGRFGSDELDLRFEITNIRLIDNAERPIELEGSTSISLITSTVSNTFEQDLQEQIKVFPNPSSTAIYLQSGLEIDQISLFSITGEKVLTTIPEKRLSKLSLSHLSAGTYILRVQTSQGPWATRIILTD